MKPGNFHIFADDITIKKHKNLLGTWKKIIISEKKHNFNIDRDQFKIEKENLESNVTYYDREEWSTKANKQSCVTIAIFVSESFELWKSDFWQESKMRREEKYECNN